ncbi:MAG: hypothetical protein KDC87_11025 [Planctomycetes bacterium]|nr:hypothetical protein [Planctomycetota bacterium]
MAHDHGRNWLPQTDADDPRLDCRIQYLEPTARGLRACHLLRVETVGDFLAHPRSDFTALQDCGRRTYEDLARRVHEYLTSTVRHDLIDTEILATPLSEIVSNPRAMRAFRTLSLTTIGEFLETPRHRLLGVRGFGARTYRETTQQIRVLIDRHTNGTELLPPSLLAFPLNGLGFAQSLAKALQGLGITTVAELINSSGEQLRQNASIGEDGIARIRTELDRLVRIGIDQTIDLGSGTRVLDFYGLLSQMLTALDEQQTTLFRLRIGIDCGRASLRRVAQVLSISREAAGILEESTRMALQQHTPALLDRLRQEAHRELRTLGGMVHCELLTPRTLLSSAAQCTGDKHLPLRLLRFCFARELHLYGDFLTTLAPAAYRRFRRVLRWSTARDRLPVPLMEVEQQLARVVQPVPRGLVKHLLTAHERLVIRRDSEAGEVVHRGLHSVPDRIAAILADLDRPTSAEDILFHYRDRHHLGNLARLQDHLRADPRFLEVGHAVWSLRSEHLDELATAKPEAEAIADVILAQRGRQSVFSLHKEAMIPERTTFLVIACLRQDPRLRYLGQGTFCQRGARSTVMEEIREAMQRAMGEIVCSRFIDNSHPRRQRLVSRLLHDNQAFVEPCEDRVDLLTNYPFNKERLWRLNHMIVAQLEAGRGYAHATELLETLNATDLGGDWLTEHMLLDLLRRNFPYELLPGGLVAQPHLGLGGWIQQRARTALRQACESMSVAELIADTPELAAFSESLEELLERDPMVQRVDGLRYAVV